ncbi:MAG: HypC/HybG/HupF family hydrogenase formation chaperone [Gammaproteobacteria bacterium]|nr:HypC/HybG/HupF family hydrogenase formation chaperone [Gammaproteobacteria bacterium]
MCIGIPMQVVAVDGFTATCVDGAQRSVVDTTLVGAPQPGDWLLVFLGSAREILDESTARTMRDAVAAVASVMAGDHHIDHLFGDLIDREPLLPAHLQHLTKEA